MVSRAEKKLILELIVPRRIAFPEMPDLNLRVTPLFGESKYSYTFIHDFLESRIRDEIKVRLERKNFSISYCKASRVVYLTESFREAHVSSPSILRRIKYFQMNINQV